MLSSLEKILFLSQVDIFSGFSARELGMLASKAEEVGYSRDQLVFREGDIGDALYLVLGGRVRVFREKENKKETIAILEDKTCFGEMAILSQETRSASVEAADSTTLLKIRKQDFKDLILKKPEIAFPIFEILTQRIRNATNLYIELKRKGK